MKLSAGLALVSILYGGAAVAAPTLSRAHHMKVCADQWKAKKAASQVQGLRYQLFMSQCMKAVTANSHAG